MICQEEQEKIEESQEWAFSGIAAAIAEATNDPTFLDAVDPGDTDADSDENLDEFFPDADPRPPRERRRQ
jgi:hypothetical protein